MTPALTTRTRTRSSRVAVRRGRFRLLGLGAVLALVVAAVIVALGPLDKAFREITLPLRHEDIIRQQARQKQIDPALIAAVIYQESKFRDRTSHAGARGLMQITPDTARFIARKSGGIRFVEDDLGTPQINISYGSFYLRYLLNRYAHNRMLAVAAYNAGLTNVDRWVRRAGGPGDFDAARDIPFPETRGYVRSVLKRRDEYRHNYANELGY
jgi:soluble lytic murein transglycosylase